MDGVGGDGRERDLANMEGRGAEGKGRVGKEGKGFILWVLNGGAEGIGPDGTGVAGME